ncbi:hypothetical protein AN189_13715 [Loktanella sp. 3ANDIMAR09]|uniref:hypothetical protein n=1 Tax=Loktanella sp. 3ANDIMAR09 TaxID=1225657 RepID=UPI0006FDB5A9|nr:hypothetical protein [Loktanella sp. 3ANDIMAR09]KQI67832.1 hypothetical protein AN189_13715 [Loktanella sp. 3ANDIMAR09]
MKHLILAAALTLSALPANAQEAEAEADTGGRDLIEEGAKLFLRGLLREADPAIRELQDLANNVGPALQMLREEMGPALAEIMSRIDDIGNYENPEILPNGDIIIRRAPDAPAYVPPEGALGDVEL